MSSLILTTPSQILDCVETALRTTHVDTIFDRTPTGFTFHVGCEVQAALAVQVEVHSLSLTFTAALPHVPAIDFESCLAAANLITHHSQIVAVSADFDSRRFLINLTLALGRGACLEDQVLALLCACLRALQTVPPLLLRYGQGKIGLERLLVSLVLPGAGFDETDPSARHTGSPGTAQQSRSQSPEQRPNSSDRFLH